MTLAFGGSWPSWHLSGRDDAKWLDSNTTEMRPAINSLAELPPARTSDTREGCSQNVYTLSFEAM
jgi:hypothetical protein